MATIACPHCNLAQEDGGQFCSSCGKALPSAVPSGPQAVPKDALATTVPGRVVQADLLRREASGRAFAVLIAVAVLFVFSGLVVSAGVTRAGRHEVQYVPPIVYAVCFIIAAIFGGLAVWARFSPLPAAIAGLVLFATLFTVGLVRRPDSFEEPGSAVVALCMILLIILFLAKAIQVGIRHRQVRDSIGAAI